MSDAPVTVRADPMTVLIVSNDEATMRALDAALLAMGDRCVAAMDFAEALAVATTASPDVAFVDVSLGDGAMLSLLDHLAAVRPGIATYAMADAAKLHLGLQALTAGAHGMVTLPATMEGVQRPVREVRARRAAATREAAMARDLTTALERVDHLGRMIRAASRGAQMDVARAAAEALLTVARARGVALYAADGNTLVRLATAGAITCPEASSRPELEAISLDADRDLLSVGTGGALLESGDLDARPHAAQIASAAASLLHLVARAAGQPAPRTQYEPAQRFEGAVAREIEKARRHGRKVSVAAVSMHEGAVLDDDAFSPALRDGDLLGRDDRDGTVMLLLPDTGVLGAQLCRRRIGDGVGRGAVGIATFPHDGSSAEALLFVARQRAELGLRSAVHSLGLGSKTVREIVEALLATPLVDAGPRSTYPLDLSFPAALSLVQHVAHEARRAGSAAMVVTSRDELGLATVIREVCAMPGAPATLREVPVKSIAGAEDVDVVVVAAEHGAWVCAGIADRDRFKAVHAADPLLGDLLARKLAGGLAS